jgi:hypothetical protein
MADTVESLRAELNALRAEFEEFKTYAKPVIDGHQIKNLVPVDTHSGNWAPLTAPRR